MNPAGSPLALAWPAQHIDDAVCAAIAGAFILGKQRTQQQDVEFDVNQLVEIAVRALSPGINDPFTAIRCVDQLSAALARLAERELPSPARYDEEGRPRPEFELNDEAYAGARILLAGRNFGCGSSREHAAWALQDYGFDAVIGPSFGDIFRTNAGKNGLLAIVLPEEEVDRLMESVDLDTGSEMTVDLERCVIVAPDGREVPFEFDEATRHRILEGLDDIAITLQHEDAIAAYETAHGIA